MVRVLAIILNWRSEKMTRRAMDAAMLALRDVDGALVVVDNDSGDGSFEALSKLRRRARLGKQSAPHPSDPSRTKWWVWCGK